MDYISIKISENYNLYKYGTNNTIHKSGNDYQKPTIGYGYDIKQQGFNAEDLNSKAGATIITQEQMDLLKSYCNALVKGKDESDDDYNNRVKLIKENYDTLISSITITQSQANTLLNNTVSSYETALNNILNECDAALSSYQKSALISVFYNTCGGTVEAIKSEHGTLVALLTHLKTSSTNKKKFIGALGIWYEILYRTNPASNGEHQYGIQNRRFLEANEFWGISLSQTPSSDNAQSIIPINSYEEANIAIAFMNQKKDAMKNKLDDITNYKNNSYKYIRDNFSSAVSEFLSYQNCKKEYPIGTLFTDWNIYTDLQINLNSNGRPTGTTSYGDITGSDKRDLVFITGGEENTEVNTGKEDDEIYGTDAREIINSGNDDDYINAGGGNNLVNGGSGHDTIIAGSGNDTIYCGTGRDYVDAGLGENHIYLGDDNSNDKIYIRGGVNYIYNYSEYDYIELASGLRIVSTLQPENSKNIVFMLSDGGEIILVDAAKDEPPAEPDPSNPYTPEAAGEMPYIVLPNGNIMGWAPSLGEYVDTGYKLPPLEGGKHLPDNGEPVIPQIPVPTNDTPPQKPTLKPDDRDPHDLPENENAPAGSLNDPKSHKLPWNKQPYSGTRLSNVPISWYLPQTPIPEKAQGGFEGAEGDGSPLVVDLDGDGIETIGTDEKVYFDHDNSGFAENTGWVSKDDGLLVRDLNNNGQIDNGTELFGNNTVLSNGQKAANGFEALADLDSNNDGIFNNSDTAWNEVKVWKDANENGQVENGEFLTLEQAGIAGINLTYNTSTLVDENGNEHKQTGTFIKTDGTTATVTDVWFDKVGYDTVNLTNITIPDNIKNLPDIPGLGDVCSLHEAMAQDTTGELQSLIQQYVAETDINARKALLDNIIFHWTGVQDIDPLSRKPSYFYDNPIGDARYLEALERFLGDKYSNKWWFGYEEQNPHESASQKLLETYDIIANQVFVFLEAQTYAKPWLDKIILNYDEQSGTYTADVSQVISELQTLATQDFSQARELLQRLDQIVNALGVQTDAINIAFRASAETYPELSGLLNSFGSQNLQLPSGYYQIQGDDDDNYLLGTAIKDRIYGKGGNDTLIGGASDDYLVGGTGSDTYFFEGSWGHDSIDNSNTDEKGTNPDKILFGEGISPSDVTIQRRGNDLILSLHNGADTVTVYSYFLEAGTTTNAVDTIEFADGTVWNYEHVRVAWNAAPVTVGDTITKNGTNQSDTLQGTSGNDILSGEDGDDYIYANNGNDIIYGGKGNDKLEGHYGDDLYIWNLGDGLDTIYDYGNNDAILFGEGISDNDLTYQCVNEIDLKIFVKNNPNQGIIIERFLQGDLSYKIEKLIFNDGKEIYLSEIPLTLIQDKYAETIKGTEFNDTIIGGKGDDTFNSSLGDDVYVYNLGDGVDTINDGDGNNIIRFGEGINFNDLRFIRDSYKLIIQIGEDCTSRIYINGAISDLYAETLEFADGTTFSLSSDDITYIQTDTDDSFSMSDSDVNLTVYGNEGNDTIDTGNGNDTIIGGQGDDTLNGRDGNDTYIYNLGDGFDTISDGSGNSKIKFGEGITLADLKFTKDGYNLIINFAENPSQGIKITSSYEKYTLEFADGTSFSLANDDLTLTQSDKNDSFSMSSAENNLTVYGNEGNDTITSGYGNDTIIGGQGDDTLNGYDGNDTYIYNLGDGFDTISDGSGNNKIKFGEGIAATDLTLIKDGYSLVIYFTEDPTQGIKITSNYESFTLEFPDGTQINLDDNNLNIPSATYSAPINGSKNDDTLTGTERNDIIDAGNGTNIITGGKGNDTISGGTGADTYIYNLGNGFDVISDMGGSDTIKFGPGITMENLTFRQEGDDLKIFINNDINSGMLLQGFFYNPSFCFETFEFADGTILKTKDLVLTLTQTNESETVEFAHNDKSHGYNIIAGGGNDTIDFSDSEQACTVTGGEGNDTIEGGFGADTYIYNLGDGFDIISDMGGSDTIKFGSGITMDNLTFRKQGNDLKIFINNDINSGMQLQGFFSSSKFRFEIFEFSDGTKLTTNDLTLTLEQGNTDDDISFYRYDSSHSYNIYSGDGNDNIDFNYVEQACTSCGGKGNDTIYGSLGNDTYVYNLGDGFDTISERGGTDKIVLGEGISLNSLSFEKNGDDLRILVNDDVSQGIYINDQFYKSYNKIETLEFADGTTLDLTNADQLIQAMNSFGAGTSSTMDVLSNPTENVSDMCNLAAGSDLIKKAI